MVDISRLNSGANGVRRATVAASLFIDLAAQLERRGIARAALCRTARVDEGRLADAHARIGGDEAQRLWEAAMVLTGDPLVALHSAEEFRPGAMNVFGYVILNCATGLEALDRLTRYASLLNDALVVESTRDVVALELTFSMVDAEAGMDPRHPVEATAAGVVLLLRALTGRPVVPRRVAFRHAAAGPIAEYHRVFGTKVHFGAPSHTLALRLDDLGAPIAAADHTLLPILEVQAASRLAALQRNGAVSGQVIQRVLARLRGSAPDASLIARELAMSVRALQRTLAEEGTSFQGLLDAARREVAERQLRVPGVSAADVALLLGYSETSAFTRAFRRWTGATPSAWAKGRGSA